MEWAAPCTGRGMAEVGRGPSPHKGPGLPLLSLPILERTPDTCPSLAQSRIVEHPDSDCYRPRAAQSPFWELPLAGLETKGTESREALSWVNAKLLPQSQTRDEQVRVSFLESGCPSLAKQKSQTCSPAPALHGLAQGITALPRATTP